MKVTVGFPSATEYLHRKFVESIVNLRFPQGTEVVFSSVYGYQLPFARNRIVQDAIDNSSDYLFFIDVDMVFPGDVFIRLYQHNLDFVNALAFRRIEPHYPVAFRWNDDRQCYETMEYKNGLLEVDATGLACTLIKTSVFDKLQKPYFYYKDNLFSSDLTFCKNLKESGTKIIIDTDTKIGHIGENNVITEEFFLQYSEEDKKSYNEKFSSNLAKEKENYKK